MRRRVIKVCAFLLLGAIVNVAVCWLVACWMEFRSSSWPPDGYFGRNGDRFVGYTAVRRDAIASKAVYVFHEWAHFSSGPEPRSTQEFDNVLPRWAIPFFDIPELEKREHGWTDMVDTHYTLVVARGWPMLSLWGGKKVPMTPPHTHASTKP